MTDKAANSSLFWVGIGASAGGLEALRTLVRHFPPDAGAVYVVVQHLSPQHKSLLTSLIGRETKLRVLEIEDNTLPEANTVYVAPPNCDVTVRMGRLRLHTPSSELAAPKPSVDRFFRSIAESMASRAVGVVLSGTGSDGTYGVQAIRAAGGITIAQSEATAKYFGMPQSAIESGCVDLILAPEEIGPQFARIIAQPRRLEGIGTDERPKNSYAALMQLLLNHTKVDFREYKASTVRRRIERRIAALGLDGLDAYVEHVKHNTAEATALFKDMMISVTAFFRDPEEFRGLEKHLKALLPEQPERGLRVWVPGCASGEEAYSVAILLVELLGGIKALATTPVQIFATDIDTDALAVARRGYYPEAAMDNVAEHLRERYFTRSGGGFTINGAIRDCVVFTTHNVCQDPPFSNIDMVTCRNLLIYFDPELQSKVLARLHYSLNTNGLLLLGKSESVTGAEDLFRQIDRESKVFKRRVRIDRGRTSLAPLIAGSRPTVRNSLKEEDKRNVDVLRSMFDSLVRAISPNCLLVTADYQIRRVYGNINRYISLSEGDIRGVTISMLKDSFRHEVRTLISLALRHREPRFGAERRDPDADETMRVQVQVYPLTMIDGGDDLAVVAFRESTVERAAIAHDPEKPESEQHIVELERELNTTRDSLQQTVEELETTNEELQALNEELQSGNEELQSTNEELETANEELQSTNEELITVNEELQINSQELNMINQELDSILANIAPPTLVIDAGLHISRCSESARDFFRIDPAVGRPHLSQCYRPPGFPQLTTMIADVIRLGKRAEALFVTDEFQGKITAAPYFSAKGELVGATAIVSDVSLDNVRHDLESLLNAVPAMIWQKDSDNTLIMVNEPAAALMGVDREEAVGRKLDELMPALAPNGGIADHAIIERMEPRLGLHEKIARPDGKQLWLSVARVPYRLAEGRAGVYIIARDISEDYHERIERQNERSVINAVVEALPVALEYIDANGVLQLQNGAARQRPDAGQIGTPWDERLQDLVELDADTFQTKRAVHHPLHRALHGEPQPSALHLTTSERGETLHFVRAAPIRDAEHHVTGAVAATIALPDGLRPSGSGNGQHRFAKPPRLNDADVVLVPDSGELQLTERAARLLHLNEPAALKSLDGLLRKTDARDRGRLKADIAACIQDGTPVATALRVPDGAGHSLWLRLHAARLSQNGETRVIGSLTDVTASWAANHELTRRSALADMVEESGGLATWSLCLSTETACLSPQAAEILGLRTDKTDIPLDRMLQAVAADDRNAVAHGLRSVADEAVPFTARVKLSADKLREIVISGRAERDPEGRIISVIGIVRAVDAARQRRSAAAE